MLMRLIQWISMTLIIIFATIFIASPVLGADMRSGDLVTVTEEDVIDGDMYIVGGDITIDGIVNGDIFGIGQSLIINGTINGGITFIGQTLTINGFVSEGARLIGQTIFINGKIGRDLVSVGNNETITPTAEIRGDHIVVIGSSRINGYIDGDVIGSAGEITISNGVKGDILIEVNKVTLTSTATVQGNLTYTSENEADIHTGSQIRGNTTHKIPKAKEPTGPLVGIVGKIIAFVMTLLLGIVIILIMPKRMAAIATSIQKKPLQSLGWGAVVLFATPIAAILTFITIIGIPIGLIGLLIYGMLIYLSQIAIGLFIGYWIISFFHNVNSRGTLVGALALGFTISTLLKLIPYVGFPIWLTTALFGIGAILLSEKQLRDH